MKAALNQKLSFDGNCQAIKHWKKFFLHPVFLSPFPFWAHFGTRRRLGSFQSSSYHCFSAFKAFTCFGKGVRPDDLSRSLSTPIILCDSALDLWSLHPFSPLAYWKNKKLRNKELRCISFISYEYQWLHKQMSVGSGFLFRSGYSGNGVKMSLWSAGSAFHLSLHQHIKPAQASENRSIGWNSLQGIFGSSLGNGGMFVNQVLQCEGNCSRVQCQRAVVTNESQVKPGLLGNPRDQPGFWPTLAAVLPVKEIPP